MTYELEMTTTERSEIAMGMKGRWALIPTAQEGTTWGYLDDGKLWFNDPSTGRNWLAPVPIRFNRYEIEGGYAYNIEYFVPTFPSKYGMIEIDFALMNMEKAIELLTR